METNEGQEYKCSEAVARERESLQKNGSSWSLVGPKTSFSFVDLTSSGSQVILRSGYGSCCLKRRWIDGRKCWRSSDHHQASDLSYTHAVCEVGASLNKAASSF